MTLLLRGSSQDVALFITSVYENQGGDYFNDIMADFSNAEYSYVAWGDYDNDTDLDLLVCGSGYTSGDLPNI